MREDAEAEFRIFVQYLALGRVVVEVGLDEIFIDERLLQDLADFFAAGRAGLCIEGGAKIAAQLRYGVTHDGSSFRSIAGANCNYSENPCAAYRRSAVALDDRFDLGRRHLDAGQYQQLIRWHLQHQHHCGEQRQQHPDCE